MMKNKIAVVLIALSVILAAVSLMILPPSVITQFSIGSSNNVTKMPKLAAIAIPFSLGTVGGILSLLGKDDKTKSKTLLISAVGIAMYVIMIVVNKFFM